MKFAFNSLCVFVYLVIFSVCVFFCNLFTSRISPQDKHYFFAFGANALLNMFIYKKRAVKK